MCSVLGGLSRAEAMDLAINFAAVPLFREPAKQRDIRTVRQADGFGDVCVWDVEDPWDKDRAVWIPNGAQVEVLREYWDTSGSQVKMERKQFYLITVTRGKYAWQKGRTGWVNTRNLKKLSESDSSNEDWPVDEEPEEEPPHGWSVLCVLFAKHTCRV